MWWDDFEDDCRWGNRQERLPERVPAVSPWMQVAAGTSGWFLGGFHARARRVPEPEAMPLPPIGYPGPALRAPRPAETAQAKLQQLGVPGELARDLDEALRAMGASAAGRVVGLTFQTRAGTRHEVRLEPSDRAA